MESNSVITEISNIFEPSGLAYWYRSRLLYRRWSVLISVGTLAILIEVQYGFPQSILGTLLRSSLRHCAASRKVAGSVPDGVIGIVQFT